VAPFYGVRNMSQRAGFYVFQELFDLIDAGENTFPKPLLISKFLHEMMNEKFAFDFSDQDEMILPRDIFRAKISDFFLSGTTYDAPSKKVEILTTSGWDYKFCGVPVFGIITSPFQCENPFMVTEDVEYLYVVFLTDKGNVVLYSSYTPMVDPDRCEVRATTAKSYEDVTRFFGKASHAKILYRNAHIPAFVEV
jgi:hypothetical protein